MFAPSDDHLAWARELHRRAIVLDTHCDTTQHLLREGWDFAVRHRDGHVDLPRLREGGVSGVFFAVYAPAGDRPAGESVAAARRQLGLLHKLAEAKSADVALARTAADIRRAKQQGRLALLIGIEGGHLMEDSVAHLQEFARAGAAYLTLTHAVHTHWADSSGVHHDLPPRHGGLTAFGREVIRELNRLGMMVDVSHVSDQTFWDVLEESTAPVLATHSSCRAVAGHRRNLTDEMLRALARKGGTVQINFAAAFVDSRHPPMDAEKVREWYEAGGPADCKVTSHVTPFSRLVDHFDHALQIVGSDHVGIGSDFDGVPALPEGMEDCARLPNLTAALLQRGYSEKDLIKVLGTNVLRVMEVCKTGMDAA